MSLVIVLMLHHPALLTLLALLPAINDHQEEPDEPMEFPEHDNYNMDKDKVELRLSMTVKIRIRRRMKK